MGVNLPSWSDVRVAIVSDDDMGHLDPGERAAIALAESERAALLLIDETAGRIEASRRGIRNTGTLGVLRAAAISGNLDLPTALGVCSHPCRTIGPEPGGCQTADRLLLDDGFDPRSRRNEDSDREPPLQGRSRPQRRYRHPEKIGVRSVNRFKRGRLA